MPRLTGIDKTGLPIGTIFKVGSAGVPPGSLRCDGSLQLVSVYPLLAASLYDSSTGFYAFGAMAYLTVQDILYTAVSPVPGITIAYVGGGIAGSEVVTVIGPAI